MRIVVLTGSQASAAAYAAMLNALGYHAWATVGADEVMALIEEAAPAAVLLALDVDSVQLATVVRRARAVSLGLPVVFALAEPALWLHVPLPTAVAPAVVVRRSGLTAATLERALASLGVSTRAAAEGTLLRLDTSGRRLDGARGSATLTASESALLALLLDAAGAVVSFEDLAGAVWGDNALDRSRIVALRTHVHGLRRKLVLAGASETILNVPGRGYRLVPGLLEA